MTTKRIGNGRSGVRLIYCPNEDICRLMDGQCTVDTFAGGEEREAVDALIRESVSHGSDEDQEEKT